MRKPRAVIYARFSPRRQAETCESNQTQLEQCRRWCWERGLSIVGEYTDEELSGDEVERPGLWAAIDALRKGDTLVVYRYDRLARSVMLAGSLEQAVLKKRCRMASASGEPSIDASLSPEDRLQIGILRLFAEFEKHLIARRTSMAMRRHQKAGRRMGSAPMYGWKDAGHRDVVIGEKLVRQAITEKDEHEQEIIRQMLAWRQDGTTLHEICHRLEAAGETYRGRPWVHTTVMRILAREGASSQPELVGA